MNAFGVIVVVFIGIVFLLVLIRLGTSISSTRRMSGQGHWSADGADTPGVEARGADHRSHHTPGHHNASHHNAGGHNIGGGGHVGGGGGHHG
jgi:hypothetical protein